MNKVTKFLMMAAIVFGFAACNNEEGPNVGTEGTGEKAWTSFTIALPNSAVNTRAVDGVGHGETYAGTTDEQKVSNARIVLYNESGVVKYAFDIVAANANGTAPFTGDVSTVDPATVSEFTTKAKELEKAVYDVYVFLNVPQAVTNATQEGMLLSELEKVANYVENEIITTNGIFMSNSKGAVKTTDANWKPTPEAAEENAASVKVPVERAVAKVFVNNAEITNVHNNGKAKVERFALDVTNKKLFWVRQMDLTVDGSTPETAATTRINSYAKDPNMGDNYATASPADLTDEFTYRDANSVLAAGGADVKAPGYDDANGIYVAENTMNADQQYEVATTRVVFEITYAPAGMALGDSFVEYKGMMMSQSDFEAKVTAAKVQDATDATVGMPSGFVDEVKGETFDYAKSFNVGNVNFYLNGINYYTTTIRHFTDAQVPWQSGEPLKYGRYGVVRNNIYKLTVNSIKGPGSPVIEQPDPEIPDDKTKNYIAVRVNVEPWLVREQSVDL